MGDTRLLGKGTMSWHSDIGITFGSGTMRMLLFNYLVWSSSVGREDEGVRIRSSSRMIWSKRSADLGIISPHQAVFFIARIPASRSSSSSSSGAVIVPMVKSGSSLCWPNVLRPRPNALPETAVPTQRVLPRFRLGELFPNVPPPSRLCLASKLARKREYNFGAWHSSIAICGEPMVSMRRSMRW